MKIHYLIIMNAVLLGSIVIATGADAQTGLLYSDTVAAPAGPVQENLTSLKTFDRDIGEWRFTMTAVARYTLCGNLVGRDSYSGSPTDTLSPMDMSFAWGKLIEAPYEDYIRYYKAPRHLNYHYHFPDDCPQLGYFYINEHSSNNHCIFANVSVRAAAESVEVGDYVEMRGYLVDVYGEDSRGSTYTWMTSRSRDDILEGACEVVWVEEVCGRQPPVDER